MTAIAERVMPDLPSASRIGQGTAVEQSRAIAEVQAAVVVAQQVPRSFPRAERDMRRSCAQKSLAEKAFYRFPRGRETVSGPSVQLARELARCFGNVQYGVTELRRDDGYAQSEMQAWAWDLETNTRSSTTFIVPHRRDKRGGPEALTDMRDIYENNANNGARRLREMIFAILPGWFTEDAIAACYETLAGDDGDLPARIAQCVEGFGKLGVRQAQLEQKAGGPVEKWTPYDLAQMSVIYRSLVRGETSSNEEFGAAPDRVTASEITQKAAAKPAGQQRRRGRAAPDASPAGEPQAPAAASPPTPPADPAGEAPLPPLPGEEENSGPGVQDETPASGPAPGPEPDDTGYDTPGTVTKAQLTKLGATFTGLGFTSREREQRLVAASQITGRELESSSELSKNEAGTLIDTLERCGGDREKLIAILAAGEGDA